MGIKQYYINCGHSEADAAGAVGKIVNAYDTYANALLHGSAGLIGATQLKEINRLTGNVKTGITQVAQTTGLTIDKHGIIVFGIDDTLTEIYLMSQAGRWGGPRRQPISTQGSDLESESSSSSTEASYTSSSSSSSSSTSSDSSTDSSSREFSSYSSSSNSSSSSQSASSASSLSSSSTSGDSSSSSSSGHSSSSSSSLSSSSSSTSLSESSSNSSSNSSQSFSSSSTSSQS